MGRLLPSNGRWTPPSMLAGGTFGLLTVLNDGSQFLIETLELYTLISENPPCGGLGSRGAAFGVSGRREKSLPGNSMASAPEAPKSRHVRVPISAGCCSNFFGAPCL